MINTAVYGANIISMSDKHNLTALLTKLVDSDTINQVKHATTLIAQGIEVFKIIIIASLIIQLAILLLLNGISYLLQKRITIRESLFAYLGIFAINLYVIYYILTTISFEQSIIASLITLALLINLCVIIWNTIVIIKPANKFMKAYFTNLDYQGLAYDFLKISALLVLIAAAIISITKIAVYLMIASVIKQIDLASMINLSDYLTIDLKEMMPKDLIDLLPVVNQSLDIVVDQAFDTYVLDNVTRLLHQVLINFEGKFVLNNLAIYLMSIVGTSTLLALPSKEIENKNYILMIISAIVALLLFIYVTNVIFLIGASGLVAATALLAINEFK